MNKKYLTTRTLGAGLAIASVFSSIGCGYDNRIIKPCTSNAEAGWVKDGTKQYRQNFILETEINGRKMNLPAKLRTLQEAEELQQRLTYEPLSRNVNLRVKK